MTFLISDIPWGKNCHKKQNMRRIVLKLTRYKAHKSYIYKEIYKMNKNTDYTDIIFLDCESVSIQDGRDYFNIEELQDDLIQLAFIDMNANEFNLMVKPNENYWNTKNWYGDKFSWETQKDYQELNAHAKDLIDLLNGKTIITHNVKFDKTLIEVSLRHYGYELPNNINWICTKEIYQERFNFNPDNAKRNRSYSSLRRLTKQMGLYRADDHHNGLSDAYMLKDLFMSYLRKNYLEI